MISPEQFFDNACWKCTDFRRAALSVSICAARVVINAFEISANRLFSTGGGTLEMNKIIFNKIMFNAMKIVTLSILYAFSQTMLRLSIWNY